MPPPETFYTRRAGVHDADLLSDLGARTFRDAFGTENDPKDMDRYVAKAFSPVRLAVELRQPGSVFLLGYDAAFDGERPVGYARLLGGPAHESVRGYRPVELVRLYVEQDAIGRGYGAALLQACLGEARAGGYATLWLGVWERNDRARRFYERWGFTAVGAYEFVLGHDVQTDLIMERPV